MQNSTEAAAGGLGVAGVLPSIGITFRPLNACTFGNTTGEYMARGYRHSANYSETLS